MNFPQNFEKVFYFERFTPRLLNDKEFLLRKLLEQEKMLNVKKGLIMILKNCDFGLFSYIVLNGIDKINQEYIFTSQDLLYDGRKGYEEAFRKFKKVSEQFNVGSSGRRIPRNSKQPRIEYLVTDIRRFLII